MTKCEWREENGHAANNGAKVGFEEIWKCGNEEKVEWKNWVGVVLGRSA